MSHFSVRDASSFLFRSSKISALSRREASSKSSQGFTLCFQPLFLLFDRPFCFRSSSWRFYMMVDQGFIPFFNCSSSFLSELRSTKIYSKINMVLNTCFVLRSSSILHLASKVQFVLPYHLRWCYVILDNLSLCFMIHMLSRMRYFKPITFFLGVILGYISPKAFPKECCYCGDYQRYL